MAEAAGLVRSYGFALWDRKDKLQQKMDLV